MRRSTLMESPTSELELVITRVFHAPISRVFNAWMDPAQMATWWGPHEFTNPVCELDAWTGGIWRITMRSPEGEDYPLKGTFVEVDPPHRLVFTMSMKEHPPEWHAMIKAFNGAETKEVLTTVTFSEDEGATTMVMCQRFATAEERVAHVHLGARGGWGQSFDSLEELLLKQQP